jgi:hypothetical protein
MGMTLEQQYDRWERTRARRESRRHTAQLRAYYDALLEHELARLALLERPEDSELNKALSKAHQVLERTREELKR